MTDEQKRKLLEILRELDTNVEITSREESWFEGGYSCSGKIDELEEMLFPPSEPPDLAKLLTAKGPNKKIREMYRRYKEAKRI